MKRLFVLPLFSCLSGVLLLPALPAQQAGKAAPLGESAFLRGLRPPSGPGIGAPRAHSTGLDGPFQAVKLYQSPPIVYDYSKRVDLLVDRTYSGSHLWSALIKRMERAGWGVTLWSCMGGTPAEVRDFLRTRYFKYGIKGCFLAGDLPVAWFEMDDDFFLRHSEFPCDLYYMDLDGTWTDQDKDGIFDGHKASARGDERPEIFLGRLVLDKTTGGSRLNAYLGKDLDYRAGRLPRSLGALSFRDDPWAGLDTGQNKAWSKVKVVNDPAGTNASAWKTELEKNYASAVLCAESTALSHTFLLPGGGKQTVTSGEIAALSSRILFLNLFGSYCGRFTQKDFLAGAYALGKASWGGLGVVASTKEGSMAFFEDYYQALGRGASLGEAFLEWFRRRYPYGREQVRWFYGMTLFGDPTLKIQVPILRSPRAILPRTGGRVDLLADFPSWRGKVPYVILGTFSLTGKPFYLPGVRTPLPDRPELGQLLAALGSPLFPGWIGFLDGRGDAKAGISWKGALPSSVWNTSLYLSCLALDPRGMVASPVQDVGIGRESVWEEDFLNARMCDFSGSGAIWGGGSLSPGRLGESGILGDFDYRIGSRKVGDTYVFDTSNTLIPGDRALDGKSHRVQNGVYRFASFKIPRGVKVRFEGPYPALIYVRGIVEIQGTLDASGKSPEDVASWNSKPEKGVAGGKGGPGGARGGDGGSEPGRGTPEGKPGGDMLVPPGHPRKGKEVGTGGKGSAEHPLKLDPKKVSLDYYTVSCIQVSAPGGGGGCFTPGGVGGLRQIQLRAVHGKLVTPSLAFPFLPLSTGLPVLPQLLLGGAGGGGAGVCPWGSFSTTYPTWNRGNGGGGGGGALALRCGGDFDLGPQGAVTARGAAGGGAGEASRSGLPPGGGGAGGTLLFQVGGRIQSIQGVVDVRGGPSLKSRDLYATLEMTSARGGDGYYRAEAVLSPSSVVFNKAYPAPTKQNVGLLTDRDAVTGGRSLFYTVPSGAVRLGSFVIEARENGKKVLYSDDPAKGIPPVLGKTPVAFFLQGGTSANPPAPSTRWVQTAKDFNDTRNWFDPKTYPAAFRWTILLDTSWLAAPRKLVVKKVKVYYAY